MARKPIGPTFDYDLTLIGTGAHESRIYSTYANGKPPLSGGGGTDGTPLGVYVGRTWEQASYGWVAAPRLHTSESDSWDAEVTRSVRFFRTRREASVFLWGHFMGARRMMPCGYTGTPLACRHCLACGAQLTIGSVTP